MGLGESLLSEFFFWSWSLSESSQVITFYWTLSANLAWLCAKVWGLIKPWLKKKPWKKWHISLNFWEVICSKKKKTQRTNSSRCFSPLAFDSLCPLQILLLFFLSVLHHMIFYILVFGTVFAVLLLVLTAAVDVAHPLQLALLALSALLSWKQQLRWPPTFP